MTNADFCGGFCTRQGRHSNFYNFLLKQMANLAIKRLDFRVDFEPLSNPAVIVGLAEVTTTT